MVIAGSWIPFTLHNCDLLQQRPKELRDALELVRLGVEHDLYPLRVHSSKDFGPLVARYPGVWHHADLPRQLVSVCIVRLEKVNEAYGLDLEVLSEIVCVEALYSARA